MPWWTTVLVGLATGGCLAMDIAARGAPDPTHLRTQTFELAPIDVPAGAGHHGPKSPPLTVRAPFAGWVHGFTWDLVGPDGRALPRELLHHLKLSAPDRRGLFGPQMLRIVGAGRETESVQLPTRVGYRVERGDRLLVTAMTHNPLGRDFRDVHVRLHVLYTTPGPWRDPLSAYPFFAQVTGPGEDSSYDLPTGRSQRSIVLRPAVSGRVLGLGGHMHRHGIELRLEDETGRILWRSVPERSEDGGILRVPSDVMVMRGGLRLSPRGTYRFVATYENPTGHAIPGGGMATLGGLFLPDGAWPEADPADPAYRRDLARELGASHRAEAGRAADHAH